MIEVFRTDIKDQQHAMILSAQIQEVFSNYEVNFDLEDCDRILRVKCNTGAIQSDLLIDLLRDNGTYAEVLEDCYPTSGLTNLTCRNRTNN